MLKERVTLKLILKNNIVQCPKREDKRSQCLLMAPAMMVSVMMKSAAKMKHKILHPRLINKLSMFLMKKRPAGTSAKTEFP